MLHRYKLTDPLIKTEAPVTPELLRIIKKKDKSIYNIFITHLIVGAFFYAMRSCKYVTAPREPWTNIISTDRILFFKKQKTSI